MVQIIFDGTHTVALFMAKTRKSAHKDGRRGEKDFRRIWRAIVFHLLFGICLHDLLQFGEQALGGLLRAAARSEGTCVGQQLLLTHRQADRPNVNNK